MASFTVQTPHERYDAIVERGILDRVASFLPANVGRTFVVTTEDVWKHQGRRLERALADHPYDTLYLPGGEDRKRLAPVETLAEEMVHRGGDRSSLVIAFGGGIVNDMAGFLAAIFMRGIPVLQVPTTLLAQVDAAIGGKTGVNLVAGKNLIGSFHQPLAVVIDPATLDTLPDREYRAGLFEVIKYGIISSPALFRVLTERLDDVLGKSPDVIDYMIAESVRIKAEVVSGDEREGGLRKILNYGHTVGHALEAETQYERFLHGEAVAFGMRAVAYLGEFTGRAPAALTLPLIDRYGPIPSLAGISAVNLHRRLVRDKKTVKGKVHFVLPERIGQVSVVSGIDDSLVLQAIESALQ